MDGIIKALLSLLKYQKIQHFRMFKTLEQQLLNINVNTISYIMPYNSKTINSVFQLSFVIFQQKYLYLCIPTSLLLCTCFINNYCMALTLVKMFMAFEKLARKAKNDNYICFFKVLFTVIMEIILKRRECIKAVCIQRT